jgi:hypothetical protein
MALRNPITVSAATAQQIHYQGRTNGDVPYPARQEQFDQWIHVGQIPCRFVPEPAYLHRELQSVYGSGRFYIEVGLAPFVFYPALLITPAEI